MSARGRHAPRPARDALVVAVLGDPGGALPDPSSIDLAPFWARFEASAPLHLAVGVRVATVAIAVVLPRLMGHRHGLAGLVGRDPAVADAVLQRAAATPGLSSLVEVAKIVAGFAYFADEGVDAVVRAAR